MTRREMILAIIDAARNNNFKDEIEDVETLEYRDAHGRIWEDRFDCIDMTVIPPKVCFIAGTGHDNFSISFEKLTTESIETLYGMIEK